MTHRARFGFLVLLSSLYFAPCLGSGADPASGFSTAHDAPSPKIPRTDRGLLVTHINCAPGWVLMFDEEGNTYPGEFDSPPGELFAKLDVPPRFFRYQGRTMVQWKLQDLLGRNAWTFSVNLCPYPPSP